MCQADADMVREWRDAEPDRLVIAINTTFRLAPWADHIYACDGRWWGKYHDEARERSDAQLWTYYDDVAAAYDLNKADIPPGKTGGNSGNQAARLAITAFGARRLILLGYDMKGGHWHGNHPQGWPNPNFGNFKAWIVHLGRLRQEFRDVDFLNATRDTAIPPETIPQIALEDALR